MVEQDGPPAAAAGEGDAQPPQHGPLTPEQRRQFRARIRRMLWMLLVVALLLAAWGTGSRLMAQAELQRRAADAGRITVVTATPTLSSATEELVLPGIVQGYFESPIYARTNGYLRIWYTDIGARVKKGQLLAEIDTPEVDRQYSQAQADLSTAQANVALAHITDARWKVLLQTHAVSQQDADNKAGDLAAKEAMTQSAAQNVARLRELESFKRVLAPFDGVITARNTDIGALINAGEAAGTELFRISETDRLRVYAQVPEAFAAVIGAGQHADLRFLEHPGKVYAAEAITTSSALDPVARTLQVELLLDNHAGEVFPGAYAEVHFKLPSSTHTLRLPANTVLFRAAGMQVATVGPDGTIKLKHIDQGRDFGKTIEVLDGVGPDDRVVVNPPDSIMDGTPVRVENPPHHAD